MIKLYTVRVRRHAVQERLITIEATTAIGARDTAKRVAEWTEECPTVTGRGIWAMADDAHIKGSVRAVAVVDPRAAE